jgi:hypothetical protein
MAASSAFFAGRPASSRPPALPQPPRWAGLASPGLTHALARLPFDLHDRKKKEMET